MDDIPGILMIGAFLSAEPSHTVSVICPQKPRKALSWAKRHPMGPARRLYSTPRKPYVFPTRSVSVLAQLQHCLEQNGTFRASPPARLTGSAAWSERHCLGQNGTLWGLPAYRARPPQKISETIRIFSESVSHPLESFRVVQTRCPRPAPSPRVARGSTSVPQLHRAGHAWE